MGSVKLCCVYGRNRQRVECGTVGAVLCESVYLYLVFECVTYSIVMYMEGTDKQCNLARLVHNCVTVCILVFSVRLCYGQQCSVCGRNREKVQCGRVKVLYCVTVCILLFSV